VAKPVLEADSHAKGAPKNKLIIAGLVDAAKKPVVVGNGQLQ
jgi:hypothetical protein